LVQGSSGEYLVGAGSGLVDLAACSRDNSRVVKGVEWNAGRNAAEDVGGSNNRMRNIN